jgi:hypothetical protein
MRKIRLPLSWFFLAAAGMGFLAADARAQNKDTVAARILSVQCTAQWKRKGAGTGAALQSPRDIGLGLSAGDQVECAGPGSLDVLVSTGTRKITAAQKWFTVPPLPADPQYPKEDAEIANALKGYGISGATRGRSADSRILWPSENSVVLPEHFAIRWTPLPQKIELAILTETKDVTLWGPTEVDGGAGSLQSDAIAQALAAYTAKRESQGLVLTLTPANSNDWEEVHFSLLRGKQEQELEAELNFWSAHADGLALRLGRGYTYTRNKLFAEAAEEYESALSVAPESPYLLKQAIEANQKAGRRARVQELQKRLASLTVGANP